jgi:histidinol dehydrogenase
MKSFTLQNDTLPGDLLDYIDPRMANDETVEKTVLEMMSAIRSRGFEALAEYSSKFDNFELTPGNIRVSQSEIDELASKVDSRLSSALETAVERIKFFHQQQLQVDSSLSDSDGNLMGQKVVPLESAAIYIPGGRALYPSTLYMTAIPAIIAGVDRIVLLSPPRTFTEAPAVARLVQILGISEVYRVGGAQAVLAAAFGAGPVKPVDKIAGPGNSFVTKAKQLVYGTCDIDMIAGPSEILVVVDTDKPEDIPSIAADLLSQAEHDPEARSIMVGTDTEYMLKIEAEARRQLESLPLADNCRESLDTRGLIVTCPDKKTVLSVTNKLAPEHLELFSDNPHELLKAIRNAGSVFLGRYTPEAVGDYLGGPNHVLPTVRTARFFSPLGVYDFQKRVSWIEFKRASLEKYIDDITSIARAEGLEAHARSAETRLKKDT